MMAIKLYSIETELLGHQSIFSIDQAFPTAQNLAGIIIFWAVRVASIVCLLYFMFSLLLLSVEVLSFLQERLCVHYDEAQLYRDKDVKGGPCPAQEKYLDTSASVPYLNFYDAPRSKVSGIVKSIFLFSRRSRPVNASGGMTDFDEMSSRFRHTLTQGTYYLFKLPFVALYSLYLMFTLPDAREQDVVKFIENGSPAALIKPLEGTVGTRHSRFYYIEEKDLNLSIRPADQQRKGTNPLHSTEFTWYIPDPQRTHMMTTAMPKCISLKSMARQLTTLEDRCLQCLH